MGCYSSITLYMKCLEKLKEDLQVCFEDLEKMYISYWIVTLI